MATLAWRVLLKLDGPFPPARKPTGKQHCIRVVDCELAVAHHVQQPDASEHASGGPKRLAVSHGSTHLLDGGEALRDDIVKMIDLTPGTVRLASTASMAALFAPLLPIATLAGSRFTAMAF